MCFTEWRAERIFRFKTKCLAFKINMGFVNKDEAKKLAMNNILEYLERLMRGKCISFTEACDLFDIASQKIQVL